jgi:serine/threonine protein kinase
LTASSPPIHENETPPALERGSSLGRYVILGLVGRGGMGEVYAAYDPELDRKVAIKLLRMGRTGDDGRVRQLREAQAIAKLSDPNVVVVYDVGTLGEQIFIAMEFVEGHTLNYWMLAGERAWPEVLKIFAEAGRGLVAAHEKGLVHRDFKPDNVMVGFDGHVRVMDFGLARNVKDDKADKSDKTHVGTDDPGTVQGRSEPGAAAAGTPPTSRRTPPALDDVDIDSTMALSSPAPAPRAGVPLSLDLTLTGEMLGTPAYMAPEQFRGRATDAKTDQFSFCVALYEALYGERPFHGSSFGALSDAVLKGAVREPPPGRDVPAGIRQAVLRGLSVDPNDRWPTMKALLAELENDRLVAGRDRFVSGAEAKLADVWEAPLLGHPMDTPAKAETRRAFLATGKAYAANAFETVSRLLNDYARAWSGMYIDACEATHLRGEQSSEVLDLKMAFLNERLEDLRALCRVFRAATPDVVENAVTAAGALRGLDRAMDVKLLRAVVKPPEDARTQAAVEEQRTWLAEGRVVGQVGRSVDALALMTKIEAVARELGYGPLLAEVLLEIGKQHADRLESEESARALEEALWAAEISRHDEVAAEAAVCLVYTTGDSLMRFEAGEIWARHAEAVLRRMGGHDRLWGWLYNNRSAMRQRQGRMLDALADARAAVVIKEKSEGPQSPDTGQSLTNVALYLAELDNLEEAEQYALRAVQITEVGLGPSHPRTAILLFNYGEVLNRLKRYQAARVVAQRALEILEGNVPSDGLILAYPLMALGLGYLNDDMPAQALPLFERAVRIRDAGETEPALRGESHFALARALRATGASGNRAAALAQTALGEFSRALRAPGARREIVRLQEWLDEMRVDDALAPPLSGTQRQMPR